MESQLNTIKALLMLTLMIKKSLSRNTSLTRSRVSWKVRTTFFRIISLCLLTRFPPMFSFYTTWKKQKIFSFLVFSGEYKMGTLAWNGSKSHDSIWETFTRSSWVCKAEWRNFKLGTFFHSVRTRNSNKVDPLHSLFLNIPLAFINFTSQKKGMESFTLSGL